jgi:hypothetical protein
MIKSYAYLTAGQNQRLSLLKARAAARAEYSIQGICTDLFYDDFVADCSCQHCKQYRADVLRFNSAVDLFPSDIPF